MKESVARPSPFNVVLFRLPSTMHSIPLPLELYYAVIWHLNRSIVSLCTNMLVDNPLLI